MLWPGSKRSEHGLVVVGPGSESPEPEVGVLPIRIVVFQDLARTPVDAHQFVGGKVFRPRAVGKASEGFLEPPVTFFRCALLGYILHPLSDRGWSLFLDGFVVVETEIFLFVGSEEIEVHDEGFSPLVFIVLVSRTFVEVPTHIDSGMVEDLGNERCARFVHAQDDVDHDFPFLACMRRSYIRVGSGASRLE